MSINGKKTLCGSKLNEDKPLIEQPILSEEKKPAKKIPLQVYFLIVIAMVMTSFASILIRLAGKDTTRFGIEPADASVIAFWRLAFATLGMFIGALFTRNLKEFKKINFKIDMPLLTLSGLFLAIHFITWNLSLQMTTVASSITIVYLMPLFTLIFAFFFLREKVSWWQFGIIILTICGAIIVGVADLITEGWGTVTGDLLALAGGISGAAYFVIGRKKRERLDIFSYATVVYGICTLFILLYLIIYNFGFDKIVIVKLNWQHYVFFALLAIGPSCLGHSLYNYSLGYVKAPIITITALGEMFGATLLAYAIFKETPTHWSSYIGMFLVAIGIILLVFLENKEIKKQTKKEIIAKKSS